MNTIYKTTTSLTPAGKYNFILSDPTPDAFYDVVGDSTHPMLGWDIESVFRPNPAALLGHEPRDLIGVWDGTCVKDGALRATLRLAPPGTSRIVDETRALLDGGFLKGVSVGFRPTKSAPRPGGVGVHYQRMILVEASVCSLPANPAALLQAQALGISDATIQKAFRQQPAAQTLGQKIRTAKQRIADAKRAFDNSPTAYQRDVNFKVLVLLYDDYQELLATMRGTPSPKARYKAKLAEAEARNRKELNSIVMQIGTAWERVADARLQRDLAAELKCMKHIEWLEKKEDALKRLLPKSPPPPPAKPLTRGEQWSASKVQELKNTEARFAKLSAQNEANYRASQDAAAREGFEIYREEELKRRK